MKVVLCRPVKPNLDYFNTKISDIVYIRETGLLGPRSRGGPHQQYSLFPFSNLMNKAHKTKLGTKKFGLNNTYVDTMGVVERTLLTNQPELAHLLISKSL